ncbi:MAG: aldo/keto reductase [Candidatus Promineifilaceae bacterium]|nr:aldo/keto reductase [Candidatus Promineifilaceae bacterium]
MNYRTLGRTGWQVSEISFGAWALGADWGHVSEVDALDALHAAIDEGVNFIDTADKYGDGRSEKLIARALKERSERVYVATKIGQRITPHVAAVYNSKNLTAFVERSLKNLEVEALDLVQLHSPPNEVYYMPETFGALDELVQAGKIKYYGVSVKKVEEAIKAMEFPNVQSVQIIFNIFRQRPAELFFDLAQQNEVGILARVPLASGLLSGRMTRQTEFSADDHRQYNRHGQVFDVGETFSGVDFETGLAAVEQLRPLVPDGATMAQFALRWILMFDAVSCAIPGAKNRQQALDNARAASLPAFSAAAMAQIQALYYEDIRPQVHQRW